MNSKPLFLTVTLGMSTQEVKDAFGPPLYIDTPDSGSQAVFHKMASPDPKLVDTMFKGKQLWYYKSCPNGKCQTSFKDAKEELVVEFTNGVVSGIRNLVRK